MRRLFILIALVLSAAMAATYFTFPDTRSPIPVLYWVTDDNASRRGEIAGFDRWLARQSGVAPFAVRVDAASREREKQLIQGLSGVCGDLLDSFTSTGDPAFFHEVGMLVDVSAAARQLGFSPQETYLPMQSEVTAKVWAPDGTSRLEQICFPANVNVNLLWINRGTLKKFGLPTPPYTWSFDEFEAMGKTFVQKANEPGKMQRYFFCDDVGSMILARSLGLGMLNETLTNCVLDDPRYVRVMELKQRWIRDLHILPTPSERKSFAVGASLYGPALQLFRMGNYALINGGRYFTVQFRQWEPIELSVATPPNGGFPNTDIGARGVCVYRNGKYTREATYLLAYLASEDYNRVLVGSGDALPPNPKYTRDEEYIRPKGRENEWGTHERFAEAAQELSIGTEFSPFLNQRKAADLQAGAEERFMDGQITAKEAAALAARQINEEIARVLEEKPQMRGVYAKLKERQAQIDSRVAQLRIVQAKIADCRTAGRAVPRDLEDQLAAQRLPPEWIENPFHQRYYRHMGWLRDAAGATTQEAHP